MVLTVLSELDSRVPILCQILINLRAETAKNSFPCLVDKRDFIGEFFKIALRNEFETTQQIYLNQWYSRNLMIFSEFISAAYSPPTGTFFKQVFACNRCE